MTRQEYQREYRITNKDRITENRRKWQIENREKVRAKNRAHYAKNKEHYSEYHKKHYLENKEEINRKNSLNYYKNKPAYRARVKKTRHSQRLKVLTHYTNGALTCKFCGFSDVRALCVDHVNNDGARDRENMTGSGIYAHIIRQNFPDTYQVLCANCNQIKEITRRTAN